METDIDEPAKYLQINLYTETIGNVRYTYFFANKNNERMFGHHMRFFILKEDLVSQIKEFGYARELAKGQKVPFRVESSVPERKIFFYFDHLKELKYDKKETIDVSFHHSGKNITWQIKPVSQRMAENVYKLLENARVAILSVIHNDPVNQTTEVLKQTVEEKKEGVVEDKKEAEKMIEGAVIKLVDLPNTNPFAAEEKTDDKEKEKDGARFGEKQKDPNEKPKDQKDNSRVDNRSLTFGPVNTEEQNQEPIKFSLLNLSEENLKEKEQFVKKISQQKLKDEKETQKEEKKPEGFKYSKELASSLQSEQYLRAQKQLITKRQDVINNKNQLWNFQFLKGNEENVVYEFKEFAESFVAELVDELCLPEEQRTYQPIDKSTMFELYEELGLSVRLCFTGISQIKLLKSSKETIFDETEIKRAVKEFKNMNYLLKVTRNKGKIRLPLATIVEYKGVVALVKAEVEANDEQPVSLFNELDIISKEARVGKEIFSNPKCLAIVPLHSKTYESRTNRLESSRKQREAFADIYYLTDVNHFLPTDLNFVDKDPDSLILRPELLQSEDFDGMEFMGLSVSPFLNKVKTERNVQIAVNELEVVAKKLKENVNAILEEWQALDVIVLTSKEVENLFHRHGVNIRYLGLLYDRATVPLVRKICMSEITARTAKVVFRATLQEMIRTYSTALSVQQSKKDKLVQITECNQHLLNNLIEFLNSIVSETEASEYFWRSMNKQAQYNFNVSISRLELSEKYFIQALIHHLNIDFDWAQFPKNSSLFAAKLFRKEMVRQFNTRTKNYNLDFTDLYIKINYLLEEANPESAEQIKSILNLRKMAIPEHFRLNGTYERLCLYLSDYVKPETKETSSQVLLSTAIYDQVGQEPVSFVSLSLGIAQIKWLLNENSVLQAEKLVKELINRISDWCGDTHPIYTEIYSIFAQFYSLSGRFEEAMNYSKTALANEQKILGGKHLKIAERYYELAEIALKASRKEDSLNNYSKAKNICNNIGENDSVFYAEVCYKVAAVSFEFNRLPETEASILSAVEIYEANRGEEGNFENETVQCYELLMRLYEAQGKREEMEKISFYCAENFEDFKELANIERVMRIYLTPYFLGVKRKQAEKMVLLFQQIPLQSNNSSYSLAYSYIRKLIDSNKLLPTVTEIFDNFDELYEDIVSSSILTRWRIMEEGKSIPHQCLSLVEALIYFVGEGFVIGALQER